MNLVGVRFIVPHLIKSEDQYCAVRKPENYGTGEGARNLSPRSNNFYAHLKTKTFGIPYFSHDAQNSNPKNGFQWFHRDNFVDFIFHEVNMDEF